MSRALFALLACLLALPAAAKPAAAPAGRPAENGNEPVDEQQYRQGLEQLRGYLEKRDEDPVFVARFIDDLETRFQGPDGKRVPVTRDAFAAFLKYEAAWARKTRDAKNPNVSPDQLAHEKRLADELRQRFNRYAQSESPRFYAAFRAAVHDVRVQRGGGQPYQGSSTVFFSDQIDDSYTKIDAADEALDRGDARRAKELASEALAESPGNSDAFVMRAGADYAQGDMSAAAQDAQAALQLDPASQQAQAIMSLSGQLPVAGPSALADAKAVGDDIAAGATGAAPARPADDSAPADDGADQPTAASPRAFGASPTLVAMTAASAAPLSAAAPYSPPLSSPASATPALGVRLSSDLTAQAARQARLDPRGAVTQLDHAIALNPRNVQALDWRSYISNRDGDYRDGLAASARALELEPRDARAYYNRAFSLAGEGEKAGAVDALRSAASLDPAYQPALDQALQLAQTGDMAILFRDRPATPGPRASGGWLDELLHASPLVLFGVIGGLMVLLALGQLGAARRADQ